MLEAEQWSLQNCSNYDRQRWLAPDCHEVSDFHCKHSRRSQVLDAHGVVEALPMQALTGALKDEAEVMQMTGTTGPLECS